VPIKRNRIANEDKQKFSIDFFFWKTLSTEKETYNLTNLMEKSMPLETVGDICYILVMQFNDFPDKNLKPDNTRMMINVTSKTTKLG
jgi:hypothetical protein